MTRWLEVALEVDGEMAEVVAEVLAPLAHQGVAIESTAIAVDAYDEGGAIGPLRVRAFVSILADHEATRRDVEKALWPLRMIARESGLNLPEPRFTEVDDADWANAWREHFQPMRVGKRLMVVPAWLHPPLAEDDIELRVEPGQAFGTGTHPTTQLCMAALEDYVQPGDRVLDVGCGSGILSIAAIKLGAAKAWGYDIDLAAVAASAENARDNGVAAQFEVGQGSVAEGKANAPYDVVVANILSRVILDLLPQGLAELPKPGGLLILSGILAEQAAAVEAAVAEYGYTWLARPTQGDWVAIVARR